MGFPAGGIFIYNEIMEEKAYMQEDAPDLDLEINSFFSAIENKESFYLGRIALLEEQIAALRDSRKNDVAEYAEKERSLLARLATQKEEAESSVGELIRLRNECSKLNNAVSELKSALAGEMTSAAALELRFRRTLTALENRGNEIRKMWNVLERAKTELYGQKELIEAKERAIAEAERLQAELAEKEQSYSELKKELELKAGKLAMIIGRLKAVSGPPQLAEGPAASPDPMADMFQEPVQQAPEAAAPAAAEDAEKYRDLVSRYDEINSRMSQLEARGNALEAELAEAELEKTELKKKNLRIRESFSLELLTAEEKMRRKEAEVEDLRAALEKRGAPRK